MSGGIDAGGDWSFQFDRSKCFMCFALMSGYCWLSIEGIDEVVRLGAGDFVAPPHGPALLLASEIALAIGFRSSSAFSTAFSQAVGCSPKHFVTRL